MKYIYHTHHLSRHQSFCFFSFFFFFFFSACRMEAKYHRSVTGHVVDDVVRHRGKIHWQGWYCSFNFHFSFFFFFFLCVCVTEKGHILMDWYVFPGLQWDVKIKKQISKADGGVFRSSRFVSSGCTDVNEPCSFKFDKVSTWRLWKKTHANIIFSLIWRVI